MAEMGFRGFLDAKIQAPIIVTFHAPADAKYTFKEFYERVRDKGFILYPGKLTQLETFRVGCIGAIGPDEMRHAVNAVRYAARDGHPAGRADSRGSGQSGLAGGWRNASNAANAGSSNA